MNCTRRSEQTTKSTSRAEFRRSLLLVSDLLSSHGSESTAHLAGTNVDDGIERYYVIAQSTTYALHNDTSIIADEFSDATLHQSTTTSSNNGLSATTAEMQFDTHRTDDLWQHDIAPTPDDADALRFQQEALMWIKFLRANGNALGLTDATTFDTAKKLGEFYASHGGMLEAEATYLRVLKASGSLSAYEQSGD